MFLFGLVIGAISATIVAIMIGKVREMERDRQANADRPSTEKEITKVVEATGPVPADESVGPFIGDEVREAELKEQRDNDVAEKWKAGIRKFYEYLLTFTRNDDASTVLYQIAIEEPGSWISNRKLAKDLGWGTQRVKPAIDYLLRNKYIRVSEESPNKGAQYQLTERSQKKHKAA